MNQEWHFFIYRLPAAVLETENNAVLEIENNGVIHDLHGVQVCGLQLTGHELQTPFELKFDDVQSRFETADGGYCEWDGAFGWHPLEDERTRMCGTIHCLDERVMCFEVHAKLHLGSWQKLKSILGVDDGLAIQFPEYGALVSHAAFTQMLTALGDDSTIKTA